MLDIVLSLIFGILGGLFIPLISIEIAHFIKAFNKKGVTMKTEQEIKNKNRKP